MNNKISKDDAFEVSDSTDWLETPLSSLAAVDAGLRCHVCKDFYTTPMITSCMHTFCSLCIRRCLTHDGKCPECRAPDQELKLRNNWAVGDLVEAFMKARPEVLDYARQPVAAAGSASPKRKHVESALNVVDSSPPRKRTRTSGRTIQSSKLPIVVDSDGDDEDYLPEDGLVSCPMCQGRMTVAEVSAHIDNCTGEPPRPKKNANPVRKSMPSPIPPQKPVKREERLSPLNYSMLNDSQLRKKLADQGISTAGSRQLMQRRYTEWITLWNANCDAKIPKGKGELKRELDIWERTQGGRAPLLNAVQNSGSQIRDKDFDGAAWASKHDKSFQNLISEAKQKRAVIAPTTQPASDQSDPIRELAHTEEQPSNPLPSPFLDTGVNEGRIAEETALPPAAPQNEPRNESAGPGESSPLEYNESQKGFFEKDKPFDSTQNIPARAATPQYHDMDGGIGSDIATVRPLQP